MLPKRGLSVVERPSVITSTPYNRQGTADDAHFGHSRKLQFAIDLESFRIFQQRLQRNL